MMDRFVLWDSNPQQPQATGALWNSSSSPAEEKEDHAHHQEQKE
jgi:hypothetical protein